MMTLSSSSRLCRSLLSLLLPASLACLLLPSSVRCQVQPNYNTGPEIWYTFDLAPRSPASLNYTWLPGTSDHAGVAVLDGTESRYIDLRLTPDDNNHYLPLALPLTFSLEYWVYYPITSVMGEWMRLFECSDGRQQNSMNFANFEKERKLNVGIDKGAAHTRTVTDNPVLVQGQWQHLAVSLEQTSRLNRDTGAMKIYVDGVLVKSNNESFLMNDTVFRRNCWIGRSEYTKPLGTDDWLNAYIDDFFFYTYPLSQEAIIAHLKLPRPPVYELTFSNDPRLASPTVLSAWSYTWSDRAEGANGNDNLTANHEGHLLLIGDSFIDMAAVSGPSSVYAQPLPRIGNFSTTGARGTLPAGYSIEVMFQALTIERFAKIYDIGSGPTTPNSVNGVDNIILGYVEESESLRFEWFVGTQAPGMSQSFVVLPTLVLRQWYHIVVVITPDPMLAAGYGNVTAYVNGQRSRASLTGVQLPRNVGRTQAYIGKSHWAADEYFDMYLDAFRLFDYSLSATEVRNLYGSTQTELPVDADPTTTAVYHTAPVAQFTFLLAPPNPAPFEYANGTSPILGHYGVAQFNFNQSMHQYIDLATFKQPYGAATGTPMNLRFGGGMSFEVWVRYRALRHSSRIFDFGYEYDSVPNSLYLFNAESTNDLVFETYAGDHKSQARINGAINVGQWQHIVCTIQQNTVNDTTSDLSATFKIYIDGVLVVSTLGSLPYTFNHPSSFLGRSNHPNDEYFEGDIDAFYMYDYALQYEQVAAHHIVPRPPVFELAFTYDPRPWLDPNEQYTYTWQEFDTNDGQSSDDTGGYHNGFLVLTGDQWINLTASSGPNTVGTTLPTPLFYPWSANQGNNGREVLPYGNNNNYGWTIELLVKLMTIESDVTIFDFGNGAQNGIRLGYTGVERALYFYIDAPNPTNLQVLTNAELNRWYHIVIVMTSNNNGNQISTTAYVDGVSTGTQATRSAPPNIFRRDAFLGKSNVPGVEYFDMKLDTLRIYDYALREINNLPQYQYISKLYSLTTAVLPQLIEPVYYTQPLAQYTFDTSRDESSDNGLSYFQWLPYDTADAAHTGVARFNGVDQWVDLMTFLDDTGSPFPSLIGNSSMSFEAWVKYERLHEWSRVFDFGTGNGDDKDNILLASYKQEARVSTGYFPADATNFTELFSANTVNNTWVPGKWQHVVVTIEDRMKLDAYNVRDGPRGYDAALWTVYLQGNIVIRSTGYMPRAVGRPAAFLAKSQHTRDQLFEGMIDSFYYYNYPLSQEQINAHILLPRPPVFDLSFSSDPRLLLPQSSSYYNYSWQEFDPNDTFSSSARFHSGHLVLSAARGNYVNLSTPVGPNTLGVVLPRIGGRQQAISGTSVGWSIEGVVKMDTTARWAKLLDWGNGIAMDNIIIGYESETSRLLLQVFNTLLGERVGTVPIIDRVVLGTWYHFVVVIVPVAATGWNAVATVYVDGVQTASVSDMVLPQNVERHSAFLGRSNWEDNGDVRFSAKIDAIRVYDYAITAGQAVQLYRLAHDSTFVPDAPPAQPSLPPTGSPTASPTGAASTGRGPTATPTITPTGPRGNSTTGTSSSRSVVSRTSSAGGFCEYGTWPNCECRCDWPGYQWPNCKPCRGEEPGSPSSGSTVNAGLVIVIIVCVIVAAAIATGMYVYWKNRRGRVTYSLDGGFSDSNDTDGSEWLPNNKRRAAGGGSNLLAESREDSSTYDWQAYRNAPNQRTDMQSWSNQ